jgi:hypothetical protein
MESPRENKRLVFGTNPDKHDPCASEIMIYRSFQYPLAGQKKAEHNF